MTTALLDPPSPVTLLPTVPELEVDRERWQTRVHGRPVHLTRLEFLVLAELHEAHGRVLTRGVLADRVGVYNGATRALDVHMSRLRRKLGPVADRLVTIRGVGWQLL